MSHQQPWSATDSGARQTPTLAAGDPWQAFGYVVAGVVVYGFGGWLLDRWWGTSFLVAVGILVGAGLGIYMTLARYGLLARQAPPFDQPSNQPADQPQQHDSSRTEES